MQKRSSPSRAQSVRVLGLIANNPREQTTVQICTDRAERPIRRSTDIYQLWPHPAANHSARAVRGLDKVFDSLDFFCAGACLRTAVESAYIYKSDS